METGLSNLAFPLLNLSNIRSCDREEVDLQDKEQEAEHEMKTLEIPKPTGGKREKKGKVSSFPA